MPPAAYWQMEVRNNKIFRTTQDDHLLVTAVSLFALQVYHVLCYTCLLCNKKLDSALLTEKDGDIFCRGI